MPASSAHYKYCLPHCVISVWNHYRLVSWKVCMREYYREYNWGERTAPCGTPAPGPLKVEISFPTFTLNFHLFRYDFLSWTTILGHPICSILYFRPSCHTLCNTLTISRKITAVIRFPINPSMAYCTNRTVSFPVECCLNSNCCSGMIQVLQCNVGFFYQYFSLKYCTLTATSLCYRSLVWMSYFSHILVALTPRLTFLLNSFNRLLDILSQPGTHFWSKYLVFDPLRGVAFDLWGIFALLASSWLVIRRVLRARHRGRGENSPPLSELVL